MSHRCISRSIRHNSTLRLHRSYRTKGSKNKATLEASVSNVSSVPESQRPAALRRTNKRPIIITPGSQHHEDLPSFLRYARREQLSESSTVYVGTHYEYTAAKSLQRLGFDVHRTGKTSDLGIDLLGWWHVFPKSKARAGTAKTEPIRVLIQCKAHAKKLAPQNVRELEGSFSGAPGHWQGQGVMGLLVAPSEATKGMRDALAKSSLPLGFVQLTREGRILQMLWNHQATVWGLETLGVTTKFLMDGNVAEKEVVLTRDGRAINLALNLRRRRPLKVHGEGEPRVAIEGSHQEKG